jgi:hypothetical protein
MTNGRGCGIGRCAVRGAIAGAVGTAAMDLVWYRRYRRGGGKDSFLRWEFGGDVVGWAADRATRLTAGTPGAVGPDHDERRALGHRHRLGRALRRAGRPVVPAPVVRSLALGPVVWLSGYVVLPLAGV